MANKMYIAKRLLQFALPCVVSLASAEYRLVWQDEFDAFNEDIWTKETGWGDNGWGNWEQEIYTDSDSNSYVSDGMLHICALPYKDSPNDAVKYTSARLKTQGSVSIKYGRIEARMRLPKRGQGVWPAFWMLGENIAEKGWPFCGEMDIMEWRGSEPNALSSTSHWNGTPYDYQHCEYGNTATLEYALDEDFHIYGMEWTPQKIEYYVADESGERIVVNVIDISVATNVNGLDCFHKPAFILINLAMGGLFGGNVEDGLGARSLTVDWVRVWQDLDAFPSSSFVSKVGSGIHIQNAVKPRIIWRKEGLQILRNNGDMVEIYGMDGKLVKIVRR